MFDIGIEKILLIMLVILLLFGAKRIPEIGQSLGKGIRQFKQSMNEINRDAVSTIDRPAYEPQPAPPADPAAPTDVAREPARTEPKRLL